MADSKEILERMVAAKNGATATATAATAAQAAQPNAAEALLAQANARREAASAPAEPAKRDEPAKQLSPQERLQQFFDANKTVPVNYNGTIVEIPAAEVVDLIQKGRKATDLNREKARLKAEKAGYAEFEQLLENAKRNPNVVRAIQDLAAGKVDPRKLYEQPRATAKPAAANTDDPDVTETNGAAPQHHAEELQSLREQFESRLAAIEADYKAKFTGLAGHIQEREYASERGGVISGDPFLSGLPSDQRELAEMLVDGYVAGGDMDAREAARVVSAKFRGIVEASNARERQLRDDRKQAATVPPSQQKPVTSVYDRESFAGMTAGDLRRRGSPARKLLTERIAAAVRHHTTPG